MAQLKFDRHTTGAQVVDACQEHIRGKTVLVTGPSPKSIGEATALAIARAAPALLILATRDPAKLDAVASSCRKIADAHGSQKTAVRTVVLDLSSQASVRAAAIHIVVLTERLDVLVNNAGISTSVRTFSPEGIETTFATNHIGPFLLTKLLLPLLLRASPDARIVNVSSSAHRISPLRFSDINFDNEVDGPKKGTIVIPKDEQPHSKNPYGQRRAMQLGFLVS